MYGDYVVDSCGESYVSVVYGDFDVGDVGLVWVVGEGLICIGNWSVDVFLEVVEIFY